MKIVINDCFGGFSLSPKAEKRLAELQGMQIFFYKRTEYSFRDGKDRYERIDNLDKDDLFQYAITRDLGKTTDTIPIDIWFNSREYERDNKYLIQVVEELGKEADGPCSELKIIEIPDGVEWQIEKYDGAEHIAEKHRAWY